MKYALCLATIFCAFFACAMKRGSDSIEKESVVPMGKIDQGLFLLAFAKPNITVQNIKKLLIDNDNTFSIEVTNKISRPLIITGFAREIFDKVDAYYYKELWPLFLGQTFVVKIDNCTEATAHIKNGQVEDTVECKSFFNDGDTIKKIVDNIEFYTKQ